MYEHIPIYEAEQIHGCPDAKTLRRFWREYFVHHGIEPSFRAGATELADVAELFDKPPTIAAKPVTVLAYVSENRWVADCPVCNNGIGLTLGRASAVCLLCGLVANVTWPAAGELKKAVAALKARPPANRHWFPQRGETAAALAAENAEKGVE